MINASQLTCKLYSVSMLQKTIAQRKNYLGLNLVLISNNVITIIRK